MPKSSIFKPFVVEGEENVRQFMKAVLESAKFLKKHPIKHDESIKLLEGKEAKEFIDNFNVDEWLKTHK